MYVHHKQVALKNNQPTSGVHTSSCKPMKKMCNENETKKQEKMMCM